MISWVSTAAIAILAALLSFCLGMWIGLSKGPDPDIDFDPGPGPSRPNPYVPRR